MGSFYKTSFFFVSLFIIASCGGGGGGGSSEPSGPAPTVQLSSSTSSTEVGKIADLVAVKGDPLTNINNMENISFVMKDGKVISLD